MLNKFCPKNRYNENFKRPDIRKREPNDMPRFYYLSYAYEPKKLAFKHYTKYVSRIFQKTRLCIDVQYGVFARFEEKHFADTREPGEWDHYVNENWFIEVV